MRVTSRIIIYWYKKLLDWNSGAHGHHIFVDTYYSSINLAHELFKLKCYLTGTYNLIANMCLKQKNDNSKVMCRTENLLFLVWKNKMLRNYYTSEMTEVTRERRDSAPECKKIPKVIIEYDRTVEE